MARNLVVYCLLALLSFAAAQHRLHAAELACMACHSAPGFREVSTDGKKRSLYVDNQVLASSAHAQKKCLDCHVDFLGQSQPHKTKAEPVRCDRCHHSGNLVGAPDASHIELYGDSVHGNALKKDDPDAPACKTCHRSHDIRPASDPKSSVHRGNIAETCGKCHFDPAFARRHKVASVERFRDSVHAKMVAQQDRFTIAAVCTDCHGVHDIRAPGEPSSSVSRLHVPETCGKCHKKVLKQYKASIHGQALASGVKSAPVCIDCHGEHLISKPSSPESPVYPTHVAATCSKCHENVKIQKEFGLPAERLSTYIGSYHGVANKYGDVTVANCATCHGAHDVLPSSDPRSAVNKKNLPRTCGKCHTGANENFAKGKIHVIISKSEQSSLYYVSNGFKWLTICTMAALVGHIALDLLAKRRRRKSGA